MRSPSWLRLGHPHREGDVAVIEAEVVPPYCPCRWRCHRTSHPCSLACLGHHDATDLFAPDDPTEEPPA